MPPFVHATARRQHGFTLDALNQISRATESRSWELVRGKNSKPVFVLNAWSKDAAASLNASFADKGIKTCLSSNHKSVIIDACYADNQLAKKTDAIKEVLRQHGEEREEIKRLNRLNRFLGNLNLGAVLWFQPMPDQGNTIMRADIIDQKKVSPIIAALKESGIAARTSRQRTQRQPTSIVIPGISFPMVTDTNLDAALVKLSTIPGLLRPEAKEHLVRREMA